MKVFVDTSAFYALEDGVDVHHREARALQRNLMVERPQLFTTHDVLDECVTLIGARLGPPRAIQFARRLLSSRAVAVIYSDEVLEEAALQVYGRFQDGRLSFTDCLSFAVMRALEISTAFAFDRHFERAGFVTLRLGT